MQDFGVDVPDSNRLQRARKLLWKVNEDRRRLSEDDEDLTVAVAEAQMTIQQHYVITRSMSNRRGEIDQARKDKLRVMLGGRDTEDGESNPVARNTLRLHNRPWNVNDGSSSITFLRELFQQIKETLGSAYRLRFRVDRNGQPANRGIVSGKRIRNAGRSCCAESGLVELYDHQAGEFL